MPPRPESATRLNPIQTRGGLRLLCLPRLGSPWGIAVSPKVGSEDPAPTPQPIAQLRRDPPVRHAVESGAVQHEKVLFYAAEGGQRGHRGGEERSESQPYASEESGRVVDRSAPRSPTCTSSPSSPSGGSHRTWTFIDRPGSGLVPPAGTVFAHQRWRGKGQKRGLERENELRLRGQEIEERSTIGRSRREAAGGERVDQFWARNLAPGSSGTLCWFFFSRSAGAHAWTTRRSRLFRWRWRARP